MIFVDEPSRISEAAKAVEWEISENIQTLSEKGITAKLYDSTGYEVAMSQVDLGVAVLSMHAPVEAVSKIDVYETYKAISAFFKDYE